MKYLALAFSVFCFTALPVEARPYYGGGHHTASHGGTYKGGKGSSHKDGKYKNEKTGNEYGKHK